MFTFLNSSVGRQELTPRQVMTDPVLFLAFGFGSGLAKKAPGTFGTLAAVPLYLALAQLPQLYFWIATVLISLVGIWLCGVAADKLGEHDFGGIVWDEIAGYLITLSFTPFSWQSTVAGFILFRFFDILKPWPIRWIDRQVHGGLGIMLDDVLAGLFAAAVLAGGQALL